MTFEDENNRLIETGCLDKYAVLEFGIEHFHSLCINCSHHNDCVLCGIYVKKCNFFVQNKASK